MNIRHECPMPDLSFKVNAPLSLLTDNGESITVDHWSLEGLTADIPKNALGQDIQLAIPFQGVTVQFPIKLKKTKTDGEYTFHNLTVRQKETLGVFYKGILSGRMAATHDVITSLDTPLDLVPMEETEEEKERGIAQTHPRILRILWNTAFYTLLALFLGGFVGQQIWKRLSYIELDHGRFVAPLTSYIAPEAAFVEEVLVTEGTDVAAGDILVRLEDPEREAQVEEVRAQIRIAQRRLKQAQDQLARHEARRTEFREDYLQTFYRKWRPLKKQDPKLLIYPRSVQTAWEAVLRFDRGEDMKPNGFYDLQRFFQNRVDEEGLELARLKRNLSNRKAATDELNIIAQVDGIVTKIPVLEGTFIKRSDIVIEVEENTARRAVGWLDDHMAGTVSIGMPAKISYSFQGQPKSIIGEIVDLTAGTDDAQPDKYGMVITIQAKDLDLLTTRKWFRHNAPTRIALKRSVFQNIFGGRAHASP